ncbi:MAG: thioredoxin-disulfide reductase [Thermogutta sp.]
MPEKVIIIGSGPAGWTAAIYAARAALNPLLFEGAISEENAKNGTLPLGQLALTTEVENFPGFPPGDISRFLETALPEERRSYLPPTTRAGITGPALMELMRQQAIHFGTRVITEDIIEVDFSRRPFHLKASDGKEYQAEAVIVATGARANYLGIPSEERFKNHGVSACAVCDGALPRFRNRPVAVIGGGDTAVEEATYLSHWASKVYLVHRRDQLRASKVMAERALSNPKIEVLWNRVVDEVLGDDENGVTGIRLKSTVGEPDLTIDVAGMFLAIGHTPNTAFLKGQLELTEKGYIKLTRPFRTYTSVEGVFAAGDVADDYYRQAVTAAASGCMAALDVERWLAGQGR